MALNKLLDTMLGTTGYLPAPRYLLLNSEASGDALDSSGNSLTFTRTARNSTFANTGPFHSSKVDTASNKVWYSGDGTHGSTTVTSGNARRANISATNANIGTTGVTLHMWVKVVPDTPGATVDPADYLNTIFDCRDAAGKNGLAIVGVGNQSETANNGDFVVLMTDSTPATSYLKFSNATVGHFMTDQLWHLFTVRARKTQSGVSNEILDFFLDGIKLRPTASVLNTATGTFADPGASQYHSLGLRYDSARDASGTWYGPVGWYNAIHTEEQILAIYQSGSYCIGNDTYGYAALGVNGGFHGDASIAANVQTPAASVASSLDNVGYWISSHSGAVAAVNLSDNLTNPTLITDALGRHGLWFDGVMQSAGGTDATGVTYPRPTLVAPTPFVGTAQRQTMIAYGQSLSPNINAAGGYSSVVQMARASAGVNVNALKFVSDQPACVVNGAVGVTNDAYLPSAACMPSPGIFGFSTGSQGTLDDFTLISNGQLAVMNHVVTAGDTTLLNGYYYNPQDGDLTIGSVAGLNAFFAGILNELIVASRPMHQKELGNLTAFLNNKWLANVQDTLMEVWGTSIEIGTPNAGYRGNTPWQSSLPSAMIRRTHWRNASWGGAQSGTLTKVGGGAMTGNGDDIITRNAALTKWGSRGFRNPGIDKSHLAIWEGITNDALHSNSQTGGDVSNQTIANFVAWRTALKNRSPRCRIMVIVPPASYIAGLTVGDGQATANGAIAWFLAHPEMYDSYLQPTITSWVHVIPADNLIYAQQADTAITQAIAAASESTALGRLNRIGRGA